MDSSTTPDWFPLPWPLNYLPSIFRFLSLAYIAPVILLSVIDVGGYLLFKLFYKPFGNYPMYSYFKQVPPREEVDSGPSSPARKSGKERTVGTPTSSEASSTLSSPTIAPTISLDSSLSDDAQDQEPVPPRKTSLRRRGSKKKKNHDRLDPHLDAVGFDGPMLDFKSPTASDYEE